MLYKHLTNKQYLMLSIKKIGKLSYKLIKNPNNFTEKFPFYKE